MRLPDHGGTVLAGRLGRYGSFGPWDMYLPEAKPAPLWAHHFFFWKRSAFGYQPEREFEDISIPCPWRVIYPCKAAGDCEF
jgi:hypothetical protein